MLRARCDVCAPRSRSAERGCYRVAEWLKSAGLGQFVSNFDGIDEEQFLGLQVRRRAPGGCAAARPRPETAARRVARVLCAPRRARLPSASRV